MKYLFTIANLITLMRLLFLPFFILTYLLDKSILAASILLLMGISDILDGFVARALRQESEFGNKFDKQVDLIMMLCIVSAIFLKNMPQFFLLVSTIGAIIIIIYSNHLLHSKKIRNTKYGKHISATVFGMAILAIFNLPWQALFLVFLLFLGLNSWSFILSSTRKRKMR